MGILTGQEAEVRIHRTDRDGIEIMRLSGTIGEADAELLAGHVDSAIPGGGRCCILDFAGVGHVDYRVFEKLEKLIAGSPGVIFSGFSDYLLSIFAFVSSGKMAPVFSDWRRAFRYLKVERGKLGVYASGPGEAEFRPPEVDGR